MKNKIGLITRVILAAGAFSAVFSFQNCAPVKFSPVKTELSSLAVDPSDPNNPNDPNDPNDPTDPTGPKHCAFNGQTLNEGESVTAFQNSSVAAGSQCLSENRKCHDGILSGSFPYASCSVGGYTSCLFNGQQIPHGGYVTAYQSSSVGYGQSCQSQTRVCNNGTLSGTFVFSSCSPGAPAACTFNGQSIPHGGSVTAYQNSSVPYGESCVPEARTCNNGVLSGSFAYGSCSPSTAPACTPLVNYNPDCDKRLKANLYFHPNANGQPVWEDVNTYISQGIPTGTLYFTDLWVPTRSFTSGFPNITSRTEYFALDIRTKLQASSSMPAGAYQLAVLSDDGAIVSLTDNNGNEAELINQNHYTSTRYGCAQSPVFINAGQKLPLRVRYYQGPADAIALVLLYRPWAQSGQNSPIGCGFVDQSMFGPFPVPVKDPSDRSYPNTNFDALLSQGWKVVPAGSFSNPDLP